jgi:hypothetical protein
MNAYDNPGFKREGTSHDAAVTISSAAMVLRHRILKVMSGPLLIEGGWTADEMAEHLGVSLLSVRPRFSELAAQGMIVDTGIRRQNRSGHYAMVWRMVNGEPKKKCRKMKPVGNKELWGKLMQSIYIHAHTDGDRQGQQIAMVSAATEWAYDMSKRIHAVRAGAKPEWMTDAEWEEMQHISGAYNFHD